MNSGLRVDNGINRGITYTDSLGNNYNLRYIPITVTNDTTVTVDLQIIFSEAYPFIKSTDAENFRLIPLPKEWALDGVGVTERMIDELSHYIDKPVLNATIEPGASFVMAVGTLYPRPPKSSGVLPKELFAYSARSILPSCDWLVETESGTNTKMTLGLKLGFGESCRLVPCGQVTYSRQ